MVSIDLKNMDSLQYLSLIEDNSMDIILTDPPYFIGYDGGKGWDSQWNSEKDYLDWCFKWTRECVRVLKDTGIIVIWGTLKTDTFLKHKLFLSEQPELFSQNEIIWSYNWGGRSKNNFARKHEYAWIYSKGKTFTFNADDVRIERKMKQNIRTGKDFEQGTIPTCVWEKNNHTASKDFINWHPTTKNIEILERIILAYTNKGENILDIFLGSGSTVIAALRTGRNIYGCEIDSEYYSLMQQRISKEIQNG
jgi:site-specific DNA-methyltransferase (adenine-specific)